MTAPTDEATIIKRRIEAAVMQAKMNADLHGGTDATAAADLMCAFVLVSVSNGADPDRARDAMWNHAKACVADFWPQGRKQ